MKLKMIIELEILEMEVYEGQTKLRKRACEPKVMGTRPPRSSPIRMGEMIKYNAGELKGWAQRMGTCAEPFERNFRANFEGK